VARCGGEPTRTEDPAAPAASIDRVCKKTRDASRRQNDSAADLNAFACALALVRYPKALR
jgi:hypothetical protein